MTLDNIIQERPSGSPERVRIFDTTLRDGEQSPGAYLDPDQKMEIAVQLARLGVDVIEAGFPSSSEGNLKTVQRIAASVGQAERKSGIGTEAQPPMIASLCRANRRDIDITWEGVKPARFPCIHIVLPTSEIHLKYKVGKTQDEIIKIARESVAHARDLCANVEFSAEDATRTDQGYLLEVLETAIEAGATTVNIPDTVGYAMPHEYGGLIRFLSTSLTGRDGVVISAHCHDDLGVATANTLAGIENGCRQVEVTINGIGERAGNACLAETVMALHTRKPVFNIETNINRREILPTSAMVSQMAGMPVQPNKAIVGENAFAHEAGIHQDGVLKNRSTYEVLDPEDLGLASRLVLGKLSGRNALRNRLEGMGYSIADQDLDALFKSFKSVADANTHDVSEAQLHGICAKLSIKQKEPVR
ncbi:MAG: 2-isopropylmalate synthase [Rhodobacter sp.]|nr:2-isopropylmalate synthase [Rhodobacter sp.]